MWVLPALLPFLGSVSAASRFTNITSKATLTTTTSSQAAASSCLPDFDCSRPGDPEVFTSQYVQADNIYEYQYSGPIASECSQSYESSLNAWEATAAIGTTSEVYTLYSGGPATTTYTVNFDNYFTFTPAEPCCGNCTMFVGENVHVYYWPTPAPTPGISVLVDSSNFTFTSPSVYIAFSSLYATGLCGEVGKVIPSTTIGFAPGQLSTALSVYNEYGWAGGHDLPDDFTAATFGNEPKGCPNITTEFYMNSPDAVTWPLDGPMPATEASFCSAMPESCDIEILTWTYNPCSATLSVPSQLFTLIPEWKTCNIGIYPFIDPPYTLTQGGDLTAFHAPVTPTTLPTAQPQTTPNPPTPAPTTPPDTSPIPQPPPSPKTSPSADPPPSPDPSPNPNPPSSPDHSPNPNPSPNSDTPPSPSNPSPGQDPSPDQSQTSVPNAASSPNLSPADPNDPNNPNYPATSHSTAPIPFLVGTQTITPGSSATVISGTTYSVPSSGGAVVVNNSITQSIPQPPPQQQGSIPAPFVAGTQTITPGAPGIVVSGTTYSVPSSGGAVIIDNSITMIPTETSTGIGGAIVSIGGFIEPTSSGAAAIGSYTGISFQGASSRTNNVFESIGIWIGGTGVTMLGMLVL